MIDAVVSIGLFGEVARTADDDSLQHLVYVIDHRRWVDSLGHIAADGKTDHDRCKEAVALLDCMRIHAQPAAYDTVPQAAVPVHRGRAHYKLLPDNYSAHSLGLAVEVVADSDATANLRNYRIDQFDQLNDAEFRPALVKSNGSHCSKQEAQRVKANEKEAAVRLGQIEDLCVVVKLLGDDWPIVQDWSGHSLDSVGTVR